MISPAEIAAGFNALKYVTESYGALKNLESDAANLEIKTEANTAIGKVHDLLYQLRDELLRLQTENHELKKVIDAHDRWEEKMAGYTLVTTEGSGTVFKSNGLPNHYMCPSCKNKHEIQILQHLRGDAHSCPGCGSDFYINAPQPYQKLDYPRLK